MNNSLEKTAPPSAGLRTSQTIYTHRPTVTIEHQIISLRLAAALLSYSQAGNLGWILHAPRPLLLSRQEIQPDIVFISRERRGIIGPSSLYGAPDLVADVVPPRLNERGFRHKKRLYQSFSIKEYWIADPSTATIQVLLWSEAGYLSAGRFGKSDRLSSPLLPSLNLRISNVFEAKD